MILKNGLSIPDIGYGTWKIEDESAAAECVKTALQAGYRHIDTATVYGNEAAVGKGIRESAIPREDIFITTKLWNNVYGYQKTVSAFYESLERLQVDYVDLYMIHWPSPLQFRDCHIERTLESYKAMEQLYREGKIRALGVSNFLRRHLEEIENLIDIPVMVNQIEFHPYFYDEETIAYCKANDIVVEAYSPLGRGNVLKEKILEETGKKYHKSPAQICIRYALDHGIIPLPKSITKQRIQENLDVFDFCLEEEDMGKIKTLNREDGKIGSHPDYAKF